MSGTFKSIAGQLMQNAINQTPEQWHAFYKSEYPDITAQESAELYPLFLQAMTASQKKDRDRAFTLYRQKLAPIKKRNPQKREQELFTWT